MKRLFLALVALALAGPAVAEPTKTVFNPFTGKLDYITRIDTNTIIPGTGITATSTNGTITINSTGGGGGGASTLETMVNGVQITSPTASQNFIGNGGVKISGSATSSTATVTFSTIIESSGVAFGSSSGTITSDTANFKYDSSSHTLIMVQNGNEVPNITFKTPPFGQTSYVSWDFQSNSGTTFGRIRGSNTTNVGNGNLGKKTGIWFEDFAHVQTPPVSIVMDAGAEALVLRTTATLVFAEQANTKFVGLRSSDSVNQSFTFRLPDRPATSTGTLLSVVQMSKGGSVLDLQNYDLVDDTITWTGKHTFSGALLQGTSTFASVTSSGTIIPDGSLSNNFNIPLASNITLNGPTNGVDNEKVKIRLIQDGATRTVTFSSDYVFGTSITSITLSAGGSKTDEIGIVYNASKSKWEVVATVYGF